MSQRLINQSLVKAVEKKEFCPKAYHEVEVLKSFSKPESLAMTKGKYFEYLATGALDRNDEVPQMEYTSRGKPSADQLRIEWQAKQFPKNLEANGIELVKVGEKIQFNLFTEFMTTAILDTEVLYRGKPYIMDIKLTQNIFNDFGDFGWADFDSIDKLQAYTYTLLKYHISGGIRYGFIYYIADYKKNPEFMIKEVFNPLDYYQEVYRRFKQAYLKVLLYEKNEYGPNPSPNCEKCVVSSCRFVGKKHKLKLQVVNEDQILEQLKKDEMAKRINEMNRRVQEIFKSNYSNEYPISYK